MKNWNPKAEWTAGKLCEKGFMEERYDEESGELKRKLTEEGKKECVSLLAEVEWRRWMVREVKKLNIPIGLKRTIWLRLFKFMKENDKIK